VASPFAALVALPLVVVGALVPGAALGLEAGRRGYPVALAVGLFAIEAAVSVATTFPVYGLSAYVACVGRAAGRVDPRVRELGARLGLHPLGDVQLPLVAAGVFGGAALAFGMQVAGRVGGWPAVAAGVVFGGVALAIDLQHGEALADAGGLRGFEGPVLLPHLTVAEHLDAARVNVPEALAADLHRRPRHLAAASRALLAQAIAATGAG